MNSRKSNFYELRWNMVGLLGKGIIDVLFRTVRIEKEGYEPVADLLRTRRFIAAVWHSRILLPNYFFRGWNGIGLVSRSEDGEIIARILQQQGHEPVRGSTSRGGHRALAKMIKMMKEQIRPAIIIPDGPRGPRFVVQPGIIALALKTGYPIVPITYSAKKGKFFSSWDRFLLPVPFTRCRLLYGSPISVSPDADAPEMERCRIRLEDELNRITRRADADFGHMIPSDRDS